jgi:hypothetical protein
MRLPKFLIVFYLLASSPFLSAAESAFVPAGGAQAARRDALMQRLDQSPYPPNGISHFIGQALGAYWIGDDTTGDAAIAGAVKEATPGIDAKGARENSFHWEAFKLERLLFLFGQKGVYHAGQMSPTAEKSVRELLWSWLAPRARRELVDPQRDWWLWGSENHHLQAWFSMWGALVLFANDPEYVDRTFTDGSTPRTLKPAFDDYFCRWIKNRATRGLFAECNSPTYTKYSLCGFYNLVDFSDDPRLRELARSFLDLYWSQWALEQVDGIRGGSRHRSYTGEASEVGATDDPGAWYLFGVGPGKASAHPSGWCVATTSYTPLPLISEIQRRRAELGDYVIRSRQPGLLDPAAPKRVNYLDDPTYAMYEPTGVYVLDPACGSLSRETYATPGFVIGTSMVPAGANFSAISAQNRWEGAIFNGTHGGRIFVQPQVDLGTHKSYDAQWSVMDRGVLIVQRLNNMKDLTQDVFISNSLPTEEKNGWVFARSPQAFAAVHVVDGTYRWIPSAKAGAGRYLQLERPLSPVIIEVVPSTAYASLGDFETAIRQNKLSVVSGRVDYASAFYKTKLTMFSDYSQAPAINGETVRYDSPLSFDCPLLQARFGGDTAKLQAFGQTHIFQF